MRIVNPEKVAEVLAQCAQEFILPRYKMLEDYEINTKTSATDLVTQADIDVEAFLEKVLPDFSNGSVVIGEEGISRGDHDVRVLSDPEASVWIVDPLDGTFNFVKHKREFGILLAYVSGGETVCGWVYDVLGEGCGIAERDSGACFEGQRLQVSSMNGDVSRMKGFVNPGFYTPPQREKIKENAGQFADLQCLHCAAHEYLALARGDAQFAVFTKSKPWDHLAGSLLLEEAGGHVQHWGGSAYVPADLDFDIIPAASEEDALAALRTFSF